MRKEKEAEIRRKKQQDEEKEKYRRDVMQRMTEMEHQRKS